MTGKKFRFSLQSVLRLREHETRGARDDFAQAQRVRAEQEARIESLRKHLSDLSQNELRGRIGQRELQQLDAFRREAHRALQEAQRRLGQLSSQEEEARARLLERRSAEETLLHLYDKESLQHRKDQDAAEMEFLDEQAVTGFHRQRMTDWNG